jgi:hypothetical protein
MLRNTATQRESAGTRWTCLLRNSRLTREVITDPAEAMPPLFNSVMRAPNLVCFAARTAS